MADNQVVDNGGLTDYDVATDKVTYSGDADRNVQLIRPVHVTGAEGSKTVEAITTADGQYVQGSVAHGDADAGNPVKIGGVAIDYENMPTDVTVGDRVNAAYTPKGVAAVALFNPETSQSLTQVPVSIVSGTIDIATIPAPLSTTGGGTEATAHRVTIANDSTGVLSVDDNGSTLSVDDGGGTLTVDGTVTANLSATDNTVLDNIDTSTAAAATSLAALDNAVAGNEFQVDVITLPALVAGTANIGDVDVASLPGTVATDITAIKTATEVIDNAIAGSEMQVDVVAALPAGTNAIGKLAANSGVDIGDVDVLTLPSVSSATLTNVNDAATSAQLLASNSTRKGCIIWNDSSQDLFIKYGTTASLTDCTVKIPADAQWVMPSPIYTGRVDGIWRVDDSGAARITEL